MTGPPARTQAGPILSIVVPLGPGETDAAGLLSQLRRVPVPAELLLMRADPDVHPLPAGWPCAIPVRQIASPPGRARQMNLGARQASGAWLWFLHADTRLDADSLAALARFIARGEPALGWFDLAFRRDGPWAARLNATGANLRSRWLGMPFGDQGFVLPAATFTALGGFDEAAPYGEDHLLVWSARQAGIPLRRVGGTVATSARKYARRGWARTTLLHLRLTAAQAWPAWRRLRRMRRMRET